MKKKVLMLVMAGMMSMAAISAPVCVMAEEQETEAEEVKELRTLGVKSDDAYAVQLKNSTGKVIMCLKFREGEELSDSMITGGDYVGDGSERILYYAPKSGEAVVPEFGVVLEGGVKAILHDVDLADMQDAELCLDEDVVYLVYTSAADGKEVNTLEAEKAAEAADPEDEIFEYVDESYDYTSYDYDSYDYSSYSGGGNNGGGNGGGGKPNCLNNGLMF